MQRDVPQGQKGNNGKPEYTEKTTELSQFTDKLYHIMHWSNSTSLLNANTTFTC
jgi:hypothetical protein